VNLQNKLVTQKSLPFVLTCRLTAAHSYAYAAELPAAGAAILAAKIPFSQCVRSRLAVAQGLDSAVFRICNKPK